ncbi:hypothetical protein TcasGA2_TC032002 [Tribolium castaneum]|uniref:Uncharacterized protein n=1 Tax=Tribolium castaneum TaxID=7070 RepID=A0A139WNR6_TRICA|nr:hypothetical protein TcasGA2_TC032002 [Tribolium castaneum]
MLIWSATILTKIMLVIVQIEKTVLSANRVKQTIVKSSMTKDKLVKREINMFLLQLLHQKINISGAKLFVINTRMIPYFFSRGIQYLLLLYQAHFIAKINN